MCVTIRPLTIQDIPLIEDNARQADIDEMEAASGWTISEALEYALRVSIQPSVIVINGEIVAALGDCPHSDDVGIPWLISTTAMDRHPRAFLRVCQQLVLGMSERHKTLLNFVDARNTRAIRWLQWLGFQIGPAQPYGVAGLPFHQFILQRG